ncbi:MAG: 4-hydroxythreonine-4-phosphate dehydrogenase PdxA, partial [Pseudomonadota bacterium]
MTPLALTQGDPAGVGPELALQAWKALRGDLSFVYLGSADQMASLAADAGMQIARIEDPARAGAAMPHGLPVLDQPLADVPRPGSASRANAPAVVEAIDRAVALCQSGAAGGLVTNPIAKHVLVEGAGFAHPGHTEYLAARAGVDRSVMMLVGDDLKTVPVTIHMPLAEVPAALTSDEIEELEDR